MYAQTAQHKAFFFVLGNAFLLQYFLTVVSGAQGNMAGTLGLYEPFGFSPGTSQLWNFSGGHQFSSAFLYLLFSGTSSQGPEVLCRKHREEQLVF